jgi:hypothetical protein
MKKALINFIKKSAQKAGVTLLKNYQYEDLLSQRDAVLELYMNKVSKPKREGLAGVLFSLDRPIQVYATLESYFKYIKNPAPIYVIYSVSDEKYLPAYKDLKEVFKDKPVYFIKETKFRDTLIEVLGSLKEDSMFFLVDDDIFVKEYDLKELDKFNPLEEIVSLRMAPYYTRSYTMDVDQLPPKHLKESVQHKDMLEWDWSHEESDNEWAYPMSVEMHLFDTKEITAMTKSLNFKAPNTYEGMLMMYRSRVEKRKGLCYKQQLIFNNPCNKVQVENDNIAGDITPEFLLDKWNEGLKIDLVPFHHIQTNAPHAERPLQFIKRT